MDRRTTPAQPKAKRSSPRRRVSHCKKAAVWPGPPPTRCPRHRSARAGPRVWLTALPLGDGPAADEPLGHALAALDARWVFLAGKGRFGPGGSTAPLCTRILRPSGERGPGGLPAGADPKPFGVVARSLSDSKDTFLEIANDSPYPDPVGRQARYRPPACRSMTLAVVCIWLP